MAAERIAAGEIYVDLNDEAAVAGLRKIEADFATTMQRIDREEATVSLKADHEQLKRDLAKAKGETKKYQKYVSDADSEYTRKTRRLSLQRAEQKEKEARAALKAHELIMRANDKQARSEAAQHARRVAQEKREAQLIRLKEGLQRRAFQATQREARIRSALEAQRHREMNLAHADALREDRDRTRLMTSRQREARQIAQLNKRYTEAADKVARFRREINSIKTPKAVRQRLELKTGEAIAEMELIQAELAVMGKKPIHQDIELDIDAHNVDTLRRIMTAITDTTVRVGPFTTTLAGLGRTMLWLGPIFTGVAGGIGAVSAALGAGIVGAAGVATGALGALGVSLGGVGLLLPKLLNDFKGLNTLQKAYHTQVLKTGANSEKAKTKLKEFEHALGEVPSTTRDAFLSLDNLSKRWGRLAKEAKPDFMIAMGEAIKTVNANFDWFSRNTLQAFSILTDEWGEWMEGLRSNEAQRILRELGTNGNNSLRPLMEALGNIATGMGRVAESFSKELPDLVRGFKRWTEGFVEATDDTEKLDSRTGKLVDSMRAVGRLVMATARFITAFFAPGVDDGTEVVNNWADSLNNLAKQMRGPEKSGIDEFFRDSIRTSRRLWNVVKPLAQLFFEWTTIMRPFADAALDVVGPMADIARYLADIDVVRGAMQAAFAVFVTGAVMSRVRGVATSLRDMVGYMKAMRGGNILSRIGNYIGGGGPGGGMASKGMTPANPLFVKDVSLGGKVPGGGPTVGAPAKTPGGILSKIPRGLKIGGGAAAGLLATAGAIYEISKAMDAAHKSRKDERFEEMLSKIVRNRDMSGLERLRQQMERTTNPDHWYKAVNIAENQIRKMNKLSIRPLAKDMKENWDNIRDETKVTTSRIDNLVDYHFRLIKQTVGNDSEAAARAASKNFWAARGAIRDAIKRGAIDTDKGLKKIEQLWVKTMGMYGFSPRQARNMAEGQSAWGGPEEGNAGNTTPSRPNANARGGLYQIGDKGDRGIDNVPMNLGGVPSIVAKGEQIAVFNHHQQKKFAQTYPGGLEGFFSGSQRPHAFQGGGIVPVPGFPGEMANASILDEIAMVANRWPSLVLTDAYGQGHSSPGHTQTGTAADFSGPDAAMDQAVAALVRMGFLVGYDGRFGSQNWPDHGPSTKTSNFHFHVEFGMNSGQAAAAMLDPIERQKMTEGMGMVSVVGQRVLDLAVTAANKNMEQAMASSLATAMPGGGLGGGSQAAKTYARAQLGRYGWGPGEWPALLELWTRESGWNPNAVNPSSGAAGIPQALGHGHVFDLGDYIAQVNWGLRYIKGRYGSPSAALRFHDANNWYSRGGVAFDMMDPSQWARGGRVDRPTLMTGEDGSKMPEYVISTNPSYRDRNIEHLSNAARELGVPMARDGKGNKKKSKGPKRPRKGKGPSSIHSVQRYDELLQREEDTNRKISIANMRVKEPDTFLKESKDANGNPVFTLDQSAIDKYTAQMNAVKKLQDTLVDKILKPMVKNVGPKALDDLGKYINTRVSNIQAIDAAKEKDRKLAKSKDKDTRKAAKKRLKGYDKQREQEVTWRDNARSTRSDIREDLHDARYRYQEAGIERSDLADEIKAIGGRASSELSDAQSANAPEIPSPFAGSEGALARLGAEQALAEAGLGMGGKAPRSQEAILKDQVKVNEGIIKTAEAMLKDSDPTNDTEAYQAIESAAAAITSLTEQLGQLPSSPTWQAEQIANFATASRDLAMAFGGNFSGAAGFGTPAGFGGPSLAAPLGGVGTPSAFGAAPISITNNFPTPPPDPHTWSKNIGWELAAL